MSGRLPPVINVCQQHVLEVILNTVPAVKQLACQLNALEVVHTRKSITNACNNWER